MHDEQQAWELEGHYIMACNCDFGCPCNFNAPPTPGHCEGLLGLVVSRGSYADTALDGARVAMIARWPGAIHEGNGAAVLFIDEAADEQQRRGLEAIVSGRVGGTFGMIVQNTISQLDGPHYVPIEAQVDGKESYVRIADKGRASFEAIRNPVTGAESFPRVVLPQGVWSNELEQYTTSEFSFEDGDLSMAHPGKVAQIASISWQGP